MTPRYDGPVGLSTKDSGLETRSTKLCPQYFHQQSCWPRIGYDISCSVWPDGTGSHSHKSSLQKTKRPHIPDQFYYLNHCITVIYGNMKWCNSDNINIDFFFLNIVTRCSIDQSDILIIPTFAVRITSRFLTQTHIWMHIGTVNLYTNGHY